MRILVNLLLAILVALVIGRIFSVGLKGRNHWAGTFWLYVLLFLGSWALGSWLRPMGPQAWDVYWVPFVIAATTIALLLAASTPPERRYVRSEDGRLVPVDPNAIESDNPTERAVTTVSIYFWILLVISLLAIALSSIFPP